MDSSQIDSEDDQTFLLIRLPKETVASSQQEGSSRVGSVFVYDDGQMEFQDDKSHKMYTLMRNSQPKTITSQRQGNHLIANEESDLFKISLQKNDAVHLGKVRLSTLLAVPKVDEKGVSTAFC